MPLALFSRRRYIEGYRECGIVELRDARAAEAACGAPRAAAVFPSSHVARDREIARALWAAGVITQTRDA